MSSLKLQGDAGGTGIVTLASPNTNSTLTFTLPSADGTNGQALTTNGSGTLAFATISASPGGSTTQVQYNNAGAFAGSANMTFDGTSLTLGGNPTLSAGTANGVAYLNGSKVLTTGSALVFDGSNLGLGVTPSAVSSSDRVLQVRNFLFDDNTNGYGILRYNNYYNGTNDVYLNTGAASAFQMQGNAFKWYQAASGTAGNTASFTQAMTLTAAGDLGLGTTSPTNYGGGYTTLQVAGSNTGVINVAAGSTVYGQFSTAADQFKIEAVGASTNMRLITNGAERARLTSGGNIFVASTGTGDFINGTAALLNIKGASTWTIKSYRTGTSNVTHISFENDNGQVGTITTSGSATAYNTSSDYRLKDNPQPLTGSGAFIDALKPKTWAWKADGSKGVGFIAHEVQEVSPGSVVGEKDAVDADGNPVMQGMEYGSAEFIANIIAELQSLRARVAQLEAK